jgi:hypothetical protein
MRSCRQCLALTLFVFCDFIFKFLQQIQRLHHRGAPGYPSAGPVIDSRDAAAKLCPEESPALTS